jgi:glycosyltransferase involved in cell wall biosynthesis
VYAGRLDETKNLEGMFRAFAALGLTAAQARLLVAGRPVSHASAGAGERYLASLKELVHSLGIAQHVHWLGARDDVPALLGAADTAALFAYNEPWGRATIEALACGTPIVATARGGSLEILTGEFRRLAFAPERPDESVAILRSLIGWRDRDPDFARRARAHVLENFGISAMIAGIERSLLGVVRARHAAHRAGARTAASKS